MARRRVASPASEVATSDLAKHCIHPLTPLHAAVSDVAHVLCLYRAMALKLEHDRLATHAQAECSTGWNTAVRMAAHPAGKFVVLGVGPAGLLVLELCKADDGTLTLELVQLSGAVSCHILLADTGACCCHTQEAAAAMLAHESLTHVNIAVMSHVCLLQIPRSWKRCRNSQMSMASRSATTGNFWQRAGMAAG